MAVSGYQVNKDNKQIQNETNSENRHLVFLIFKKKEGNNGVGDISSSFQIHCQTNRMYNVVQCSSPDWLTTACQDLTL